MGYNIQGLTETWKGGDYRTEEHRKTARSFDDDGEFSFLSMRDLPQRGEWKMRFLPPAPDKLPEGYLEVAKHWLDPDPHMPERKHQMACLRPKQCYICDLLEALSPLRAARRLEPAVLEAMNKSECSRQLVFVISIFVTPLQTTVGEKKKITWGPPYDQEHGAIFQVRKPSKILDQIMGLLQDEFQTTGDITAYSNGRYLTLIKALNHYDIRISSNPCELENKDLLTKYPDVKKRSFGQAYLTGSYGEQETAIAGCWWAQGQAVRALMTSMRQGGQVYNEGAGLTSAQPGYAAFVPGPGPFPGATTPLQGWTAPAPVQASPGFAGLLGEPANLWTPQQQRAQAQVGPMAAQYGSPPVAVQQGGYLPPGVTPLVPNNPFDTTYGISDIPF